MLEREWARVSDNGYEVSSVGDKRFSALYARLRDGRTIEQAYQLDVKGYRVYGNDWRAGKGKKPLNPVPDLWVEYLALWEQWAVENPSLVDHLSSASKGKVLTDHFAKTEINQARALATILTRKEKDART